MTYKTSRCKYQSPFSMTRTAPVIKEKDAYTPSQKSSSQFQALSQISHCPPLHHQQPQSHLLPAASRSTSFLPYHLPSPSPLILSSSHQLDQGTHNCTSCPALH